MFCHQRLAIFLRLGLKPSSSAKCYYWADIPNITYMPHLPSRAAARQAWGSLARIPYWQKLRVTPGTPTPRLSLHHQQYHAKADAEFRFDLVPADLSSTRFRLSSAG